MIALYILAYYIVVLPLAILLGKALYQLGKD